MCLACKEYIQDNLKWSEWFRNANEFNCFGDKDALDKWDLERNTTFQEALELDRPNGKR